MKFCYSYWYYSWHQFSLRDHRRVFFPLPTGRFFGYQSIHTKSRNRLAPYPMFPYYANRYKSPCHNMSICDHVRIITPFPHYQFLITCRSRIKSSLYFGSSIQLVLSVFTLSSNHLNVWGFDIYEWSLYLKKMLIFCWQLVARNAGISKDLICFVILEYYLINYVKFSPMHVLTTSPLVGFSCEKSAGE